MKKITFLLLGLFLAFALPLKALYMGMEMRYECLGGCNYRIYLTRYIDCAGSNSYAPINGANPYPTPIPALTVVGNGCTAPNLSGQWVLDSWQEVSPTCSLQPTQCSLMGAPIWGVGATSYYMDYNFCSSGCTSVTIAWGALCWPYMVTSGATANGLYSQMTIDDGNTSCNSSPYFLSPPPVYISSNQTSVFSQSAFDANNDSLAYILYTPWQDSNTPINYNTVAGYSPTSPLGPSWNVSLNPINGELSFSPVGGSGLTVIAVVGIKVLEYRNGQLIGNTTRDIGVTVLSSTSVNTAPSYTISSFMGGYLANNTLQVSPNVACGFDITATDLATQMLNFSSTIATQFPGATVTGIPNTNPLQLHVNFIPSTNQLGNIYPLWVDMFDDNCPILAHTTCFYKVKVSNFIVSPTITTAACGTASGSINLSITGGVPPFAYSWSNGANTQNISNLLPGQYAVQVTDANNGTYNSPLLYITAGNLQTNLNLTPPNCYLNNGAIVPQTTNGTPPYTFTWNTGVIADSLTGLGVGGYSVNIMDAAGCFEHEVTILGNPPGDSCFSHIKGRIYYDTNNNCVQDTWEVGLANTYLDLNPGGAVLSDLNGDYTFTVYDTGTYLLTYYPYYAPLFGLNPCHPSATETVRVPYLGIDSVGQDLPSVVYPDLKVVLGSMTTSSLAHVLIFAQNVSFYLSNVTLTYQHPTSFTNLSYNPPYTSYDPITHTATWQFTNFIANSNKTIDVSIPLSSFPFNSSSIGNASILPVVGDVNPQNNQDTATWSFGIAVASGIPYDPNNKLVTPKGETPYGLIPPTTPTLEYVINFQNTGNWYATYVALRDTIDKDLDITSIEMQMSSHPCAITVEQDSILVFTFNNINLPDSTTDEPNSHGFVKFGMNLKPNLPLDTQIDNSVAIYFDYNAPVITNSVKNTLYNPMQLVMADSFTLCPTDLLTLTVQDGKAPYTFSWDNGTVVSGNTTGVCTIPANFLNGTHTVQVSDFYGAIRHRTFMIASVLPFADASFSSSSTGNTVAFSANVQGLASYAWDFGNGQTSTQASANITYTNAGTYPVSLIVTDNCGRKDTMTTEINVSVNIADAEFTKSVRLFPNPFSQFTTLSFDNPDNSPYELSIFDLSGKLVQKISNIRSNEVKISMENKAKGSYLWELKGKSKARGMLWVE